MSRAAMREKARDRFPGIAALAACIVGVATLAGCSSAPSESEIKTAIERQLDAQRKAVEGFVGKQAAAAAGDLGPKVNTVRKIGCKEDGEKAYRCDVEMEVTAMGSTSKNVTSMRFVKGSDGWTLANG